MSKTIAIIGRDKCIVAPAIATQILSLDSSDLSLEPKCKALSPKIAVSRASTAFSILKTDAGRQNVKITVPKWSLSTYEAHTKSLRL